MRGHPSAFLATARVSTAWSPARTALARTTIGPFSALLPPDLRLTESVRRPIRGPRGYWPAS